MSEPLIICLLVILCVGYLVVRTGLGHLKIDQKRLSAFHHVDLVRNRIESEAIWLALVNLHRESHTATRSSYIVEQRPNPQHVSAEV